MDLKKYQQQKFVSLVITRKMGRESAKVGVLLLHSKKVY